MRILILGGQGMLGHKVYQILKSDHDTFATFRTRTTTIPVYKDEANKLVFKTDALSFNTIVQAFGHTKPDIVINCIGLIKQLDAAKRPDPSIRINALFPHQLADLCQAAGARLFQISTDCVFSGNKGNYTEEDTPDPVDLYGRTKLLGEINKPHCLTLRTSIIGRDFLKSVGLLEWFLQQQGKQINGFTRAIYTGLTTSALSHIIQQLIIDYPELNGIYHVASQPISKYNLLKQIRDTMKLDIDIQPSSTFFCDRSLNAKKFTQHTDIIIPTWEDMIEGLLTDDTPYNNWR